MLIARLNASDRQAFALIYDRYGSRVASFVRSLLPDGSSAEDIIQLVFLRLWEHRTEISPDGNLGGWLYICSRNAVFKESRRILNMARYVQSVMKCGEEPADVLPSPDYTVIQETIMSTIASFPPAMKKIYLMHYDSDLSVAQIASRLSLSPKTVETQLLRARRILQKKVKNF